MSDGSRELFIYIPCVCPYCCCIQVAGIALAKLAKTEKVSSAGLALLKPLEQQQQHEAATRIAAGEHSRNLPAGSSFKSTAMKALYCNCYFPCT